MRIRKPVRHDREGILAVLRSDHTFHEAEIIVAMELIDDALMRPDSDYRLLVCEGGEGCIWGYICYGQTPMTVGTYDLYWIATQAEARGKGIASRLLAAMEQELRTEKARLIRVETSRQEAYGSARHFYQKRDFVEVGCIPDFYRPADDLIIFSKKLG